MENTEIIYAKIRINMIINDLNLIQPDPSCSEKEIVNENMDKIEYNIYAY